MVEECVSFVRFSPRKLRSALRPPPPDDGGLPPAFGTKLFMLAQASISVPSTEKCSLDGELVDLRQVQHAGKELGRDIVIEQAIAVLAEHGGIPDRIIGRQSDEPAEQKIVVELLHQLPFRAHRVERLQQQCTQQSLRRDRWSAVARTTCQSPATILPAPRQSMGVRPQRMISRYPPPYRDVAEESIRSIISPRMAILIPKESRTCTESHSNRLAKRLFQQPARGAPAPRRLRRSRQAQEWLGQQVARGSTDPKHGYTFEIRRVLDDLSTGRVPRVIGGADTSLPDLIGIGAGRS